MDAKASQKPACRGFVWAFRTNTSGSIVVVFALGLPIMLGMAALAIDVSFWQMARRSMQGASDAAAYSAVIALVKNNGTNITTQAKAIAAENGFVDGVQSVTVTVNKPPSSGAYAANLKAIEVQIQQPQVRFLSGYFLSSDPVVSARSVAVVNGSAACILALDPTANNSITASGGAQVSSSCDIVSNSTSSNAIVVSGSATMSSTCVVTAGNVSGVSAITSTKCSAPFTGAPAVADPYASVSEPTASGGCLTVPSSSTFTLSPGNYCGGIIIPSGKTATFLPGTYYSGGNVAISGSASASGTGVTIFTAAGKSVAISAGSTVNFTAPTSGTYSGIVFFGSRSSTNSTNNAFSGSSTASVTGALYFPTSTLTFSGSSSNNSCTQIVADKITFSGTAAFGNNCTGVGTSTILVNDGTVTGGAVKLVE